MKRGLKKSPALELKRKFERANPIVVFKRHPTFENIRDVMGRFPDHAAALKFLGEKRYDPLIWIEDNSRN